ncbi:class I adenylate cyclase [Lacimicrobium alkaliphilum]|uniref:Adenylate cyclase n=1 Tax=Lacimicrobium alkaliphilum TaxID=1526571 RepID=A0A0U2ZL19_9ALTE|nr:class I adenylate cyclase [Lacimicrobium alkaliphilum]ALS99703.1 adenylate cyclase [Lacimicrobium alkaliphilum]
MTAQKIKIQQNLAIRLLRVLRYNKARNERALELMPADKRPLFHVIPFLLHINHPDFPGYIEQGDVPFGLNHYSLRKQVSEALAEVFGEAKASPEKIRAVWPQSRCIESLVLMGSIGTIAQSSGSDFDYWVCVKAKTFAEQQRALLQQKLEKIEQWAEEQGLEVHFFLSDIEKVRHNDFGEADGESSGSAQAVFLKAEFYTTNVVVAGKLPFWWLMPDKVTDGQYQELMESLQPGQPPDPRLFMDLGNLQKMDPGELFGAAIWQISKAMDSPFKSVLKMAKLEVFLENINNKQPLCNLLKKKVHSGVRAPGELEHVDPYGLMFDELVEHYQSADEPQIVELLQTCLYIKCGCELSRKVPASQDNFKRRIMAGYVQQWGWSQDKVARLDNIKHWSFREFSLLSRQIHGFLILCYRRISSAISLAQQSVSDKDMTVIGRKLDTYYSKKPNKIEYLRSAFDDELYRAVVTIKARPLANREREWSLYSGNQINCDTQALETVLLKSGDNPVDLVVWGVWNRILDNKTRIYLDYHTEPVTEEDLSLLVSHCQQVFPSVRVSALSREALLAPARLMKVMAVVNFDSRRPKSEVKSVRIVSLNSWGELYVESGFEALSTLQPEFARISPVPSLFVMLPVDCYKERLLDHFLRRSGVGTAKLL